MPREYYDTDVAPNAVDWNELNESKSETSDYEEVRGATVRTGNLEKWQWSNLHGELPNDVKHALQKKGYVASETMNLVHPLTGKPLGVKVTQLHPYYVVWENNGKDTQWVATTSPAEYVAIMKAVSPDFVEHDKGYAKWQARVQEYNKKYPRNTF
jgi:hypothetical protein